MAKTEGDTSLFSNQKNKPASSQAKKLPISKDSAVTILTSGCHFTGKLYCRGSSRIGGRIEGEIISEGLLIVEESAMINATIVADEAIIQGTVKGRIKAKNRMELARTCRFEGDIMTPSLVVYEGAQFNGRSQMLLAKESVGGKVIEPAAGFGAGKIPDLKPDPDQMNDDHVPDVAMMKLSEMPQPG